PSGGAIGSPYVLVGSAHPPKDTESSRRSLAFVALALAFAAGNAVADDKKPSKPERFTYRVVGLFAPGREKVLRDAFAELPDFKLVAINFDEAEMTIEFDPAKLFPGQKPERVIELVSDKVRAVTNHTFSVKPRRT